MLADSEINRAISAIRERADRQTDAQKLIGAFVDIGLLNQINNKNNQIIFGRRGTGKTHIFRVLQAQLGEPDPVLYLDARTLGSSTQFSDTSATLSQRCTALFRDILGEMYNALLDNIVQRPTDAADAALLVLEQFGIAATKPFQRIGSRQIGTRSLTKKLDRVEGSLSLSIERGAELSLTQKGEEGDEEETTSKTSVIPEDKIIFPAVHHILRDLLTKLGCTFYIFIDEWSSLPFDVQPYLAEFLKKSLFPNPAVVVKIASLEHRSNFNINRDPTRVGFELGSDVGASVNIDDYYIYDRDPATLLKTFSEVLIKHLESELPRNYLKERYGISGSGELYPGLFENKAAFQDLVRASEGVVRDLIHIFTSSYFSAQIKEHKHITQENVKRAARAWFQKDKAQNMDGETRVFLDDLCAAVIGKHEARVFLVGSAFEHHAMLESLLDLRILHLLRRGYADPKRPGIRFSVFTLDYGTYVELAHTARQPLGFFKKRGRAPVDEMIVPFEDDDRYVKKVVIPAVFFDRHTNAAAVRRTAGV